MFDFRYHALSLTAVIVALVLGVVLGVAIGDKGLLSSSEKKLRENVEHNLSAADQHIGLLESELDDRESVQNKIFPLFLSGKLADHDIGIVFLGPTANKAKTFINAALDQTGANVQWVLSVNEPLDAQQLSAHATGTQYTALAATPSLFAQFGQRIGQQLADGGQLIGRERSTLAGSFDGTLAPVNAVIVVKNSPTDMTAAERAQVVPFEAGLVRGMVEGGATVVGVQTQTAAPSSVAWFSNQRMTYVSNVDQFEGRVSLVFALDGTIGQFGHGSHEQVLPQIGQNQATTP